MTIIKVEHDNGTFPPQYIVVGDENPYTEAEKLFLKHMDTCVITHMTRIGIGGDVINLWTQ